MMSINEKRELLRKIDPVCFKRGEKVFEQFMEKYIVHRRGLFIVGPSGCGKTYFVKHQREKHWIDGDILWTKTGAAPKRAWWAEGTEIIDEVDRKSDVITMQAKKLGLWVVGASFFGIKPDAIVIPTWERHQKNILKREKYHYGGGATSKDFEKMVEYRKFLRKYATDNKIPVFKTMTEAVDYLTIQGDE
jgi:hypothetical protein